ncbi:hypothetical protein [Marinicrinis lubricantis]|uniref:Uncharacterized protein n=1 Tax=Marinicrinis lubricantis TaxID=2086470 RepID=A0ABW1IMY7_9BACL
MLKVLAWIFFPYIMLFLHGTKLDKNKRYFGVAWSIIVVIAIVSSVVNNSGKDKELTAVPAV